MADINFQDIFSKLSVYYYTVIRILQDKIQSPRIPGIFISVFLLGFTSARLTVSLISYSIASDVSLHKPQMDFNSDRPKKNLSMASIDLGSIIDGVFFKRAVLASTGPEVTDNISVRNFSLIGTLEGDKAFARAVIRVQGSKDEPTEYAIDEKIGSAVLIAIGYEKIWVRINGEKFKIEVGQKFEDAPPPAGAPGGEATPQTKILSRQEINDKILGNPTAIYGKGASFGPYVVDGKIEGFKLHRIPDGHIFYTLGARSGDIIKSINGHKLANTGQMMEIWNNIKTVPKVTVDLIRGGTPMTFDFEIRN
jgi:general secretion pathway protein C